MQQQLLIHLTVQLLTGKYFIKNQKNQTMKQLFFLLTLMSIASFGICQKTQIQSWQEYQSKHAGTDAQNTDTSFWRKDLLKTVVPIKHDTVTIREVYMQKTDTVKVAITYATKSGTVKLTEGFIQRTAYYSNAIQNDCHCQVTQTILWAKNKKPFEAKNKKLINVAPL